MFSVICYTISVYIEVICYNQFCIKKKYIHNKNLDEYNKNLNEYNKNLDKYKHHNKKRRIEKKQFNKFDLSEKHPFDKLALSEKESLKLFNLLKRGI